MYLIIFLIILLISIKYEEIILTYIFFILYLTYIYFVYHISYLFWFLIIIYSSALAIIFIITIMLFNIYNISNIKVIYDYIPSKINIYTNKIYILYFSIFILILYFILSYNNINFIDFIINNTQWNIHNLNQIIINLYYNYFFTTVIIIKLLFFYLFIIFKILNQ